MSVRGKSAKEKLGGIVKSIGKTADEVRLSAQKDQDEFYENQRQFLSVFYQRITDSTGKADRMTHKHKGVADCYIKVSTSIANLATVENEALRK